MTLCYIAGLGHLTEAQALQAGAADYDRGLEPQHTHSFYLDGYWLAATAAQIKEGHRP